MMIFEIEFTLFLEENFVVCGPSPHEFEMCYECVFQKGIYCNNYKYGEMNQRYPKNYFVVLFWSKHTGISFKSHFKHLILKVAVWLRGNASVP